MLQVIEFDDDAYETAEVKCNAWLRKENPRVIDIRYASVFNSEIKELRCSILILYQEKTVAPEPIKGDMYHDTYF